MMPEAPGKNGKSWVESLRTRWAEVAAFSLHLLLVAIYTWKEKITLASMYSPLQTEYTTHKNFNDGVTIQRLYQYKKPSVYTTV